MAVDLEEMPEEEVVNKSAEDAKGSLKDAPRPNKRKHTESGFGER